MKCKGGRYQWEVAKFQISGVRCRFTEFNFAAFCVVEPKKICYSRLDLQTGVFLCLRNHLPKWCFLMSRNVFFISAVIAVFVVGNLNCSNGAEDPHAVENALQQLDVHADFELKLFAAAMRKHGEGGSAGNISQNPATSSPRISLTDIRSLV